jgi:hypothetical protein
VTRARLLTLGAIGYGLVGLVFYSRATQAAIDAANQGRPAAGHSPVLVLLWPLALLGAGK